MNNFKELKVSELSREHLMAVSGGIGDGFDFTMPTDPNVRKGMHEGMQERWSDAREFVGWVITLATLL